MEVLEEIPWLKAGGHHQHVGRMFVAVAVDNAVLGHAGDRARHEFHVLAQERRVEIAREHRSLAGKRIRRRRPFAQCRPIGKRLVLVTRISRDGIALPFAFRIAHGHAAFDVEKKLRSREPAAKTRTEATPFVRGEVAFVLRQHVSRFTRPATGAIAGTTWAADDPVPTTATCLPVRSCWCSQRAV